MTRNGVKLLTEVNLPVINNGTLSSTLVARHLSDWHISTAIKRWGAPNAGHILTAAQERLRRLAKAPLYGECPGVRKQPSCHFFCLKLYIICCCDISFCGENEY